MEGLDVGQVTASLRRFAHERDWEQFHHPKNLAMALAAESGELLEVFQWLTEDQSRTARANRGLVDSATEEIADILIYLFRLADVLEIDLGRAVHDKIEANARRYPLETTRGTARKVP